jgi:hybrid cluster-associated redox disulfide protein
LRWRKEDRLFFGYSKNMGPNLSANWTAAQVMKTYPQAVSVFIALKTNCVGCHLDRFCSLEEVAASYEISPELLLQELNKVIQIPTHNAG